LGLGFSMGAFSGLSPAVFSFYLTPCFFSWNFPIKLFFLVLPDS